ncbi:hypothetical protein J4Q44_G00384840 [Coregonus suidteri]|uniref:Uncharacterized protein n=1 Tax=Coregonus suidteri TaxID=861788 RepID=A0AAN8KGT4_9TELE
MCKLSLFILLLIQVPASARVWVNQWSLKNSYIAGETATLYCNITSDQEKIIFCRMKWVIKDQGDLLKAESYKHRVNMSSTNTAASMTWRNLTLKDTMPTCIAQCHIDGVFQNTYGNGGTLHIFDDINQMTTLAPKEFKKENDLPWLNYIFISINILIFFVATVICASYFRTQMKRN